MLDGHIHIGKLEKDNIDFLNSLHNTGFTGGVIISPAPASFQHIVSPKDWITRLDYVEEYCKGNGNLFPFLWIDPTEDDIEEQIITASPRVDGFKIIL